MIAVTYGFLMGLPFSAFGETVVGALRARRSPCHRMSCPRRRPSPLYVTRHCSPSLAYQRHRPTVPNDYFQALLLQNSLLLFLIYYYQRRSVARGFTVTALLAGAGAVALSGQLSTAHISTLYDCNNLLLVASRSAALRFGAPDFCALLRGVRTVHLAAVVM